MRRMLCLLLVVLPASMRRMVARTALGWDIHPTAHLGRSVVMARHVSMGPRSAIGPRNVIRGLDELILEEGATIASGNRVSAVPPGSPWLAHVKNRQRALILRRFAGITVDHQIDCTDRVELGEFSAIAGFGSQVLTHSLDLVRDRQTVRPVEVGERTIVMTACVLLCGAIVPPRSVVSAASVVANPLTEELTFYRGNPAVAVRSLPARLAFFHRTADDPRLGV